MEVQEELKDGNQIMQVLDSVLSQIRWRLKLSLKRRLQIDVLALCAGLRPVILVDYGGKMPELQERVCALSKGLRKQSSIFEQLRIMIIEDMVYLIHVGGLVEHIRSSLSLEVELIFVDLEQDPPKIVSEARLNSLVMELKSIQEFFSLVFLADGNINTTILHDAINHNENAQCSNNEAISSQSLDLVDLSSCMIGRQVTLPSLNGWLLGYPVIYIFGKDHAADVSHNLSSCYLHLYKISVCRNNGSSKGSQQEDLMCFSIPYNLSTGGMNEPWAEVFVMRLQSKFQRCAQVWKSLQMTVTELNPQAIVL